MKKHRKNRFYLNISIFSVIILALAITLTAILLISGNHINTNTALKTIQRTTAPEPLSTSDIPFRTESSSTFEIELISETAPSETLPENPDFVQNLTCAGTATQLIIISANGSTAQVTMHEKDSSGTWIEIMNTTGFVGKNSVGKASESDTKTPSGDYSFGLAFGIKSNPGTAFNYIQVDDTYYWVDDPDSAYYNNFVTTNSVSSDNWNSAEHIIDYPDTYAYVLSINYNTDCIPGEGSAIFLHCSNGRPTLGCVAIPESDMIFVLNHIKPECRIIIDAEENIMNY